MTVTFTDTLVAPQLCDNDHWLLWDLDKGQKVPYSPWTNKRVDATKSTNWSSFPTAKERAIKEQKGIGFALGPVDDERSVAGVDLDKCRNPVTGVIEPWARRIISFVDSYTEISPSGTGVKIFLFGRLAAGAKQGKVFKVEIYDHDRYFTVTGSHLAGTPATVNDRTEQLNNLHSHVWSPELLKRLEVFDFIIEDRGEKVDIHCPWESHHTPPNKDKDASLFLTNDTISGFKCLHAGCSARHLPDVREFFALPKSESGTSAIAGRSHVTKLINLALSRAELFQSPDGDLYAMVPVGTFRDTLPLTGGPFKHWLAHEYFLTTNVGVGGGDLASAVTSLAGATRASGQIHPVYTRIAAFDDVVHLDLCREDRAVLTITANGWTVGASAIRFVRREGMRPLPLPRPGRSLMELLPMVVNVRGDNLKLYIAWQVACLRGRKPFPILVIRGEHGTAKTSACKTARECLDPNKADLSFTPKEPRDLLIAALNSHVIGFDNLSTMPDWLSDILCSIATGAGFRTRQLTTDHTEIIFSAARPTILNSITDIVCRPDLVDRALMVTLEPISEEDRRTEAEMDARFADVQPEILAALADAVRCSLCNPVTLSRLPRLADFAVTIESAAPALGWAPEEFLTLYASNREQAVETILNDDVLFNFLEGLHTQAMERPSHCGRTAPWVGKSQELLDELRRATPLDLHDQLPKSPKELIGELARLAPALRKAGIRVVVPRVVKRQGKTQREMEIHFVEGTEVLAL